MVTTDRSMTLTEPLVGSGTAGGLLTTAKRDVDTWIINGQKNGSAMLRGVTYPSFGPAMSRTTKSKLSL